MKLGPAIRLAEVHNKQHKRGSPVVGNAVAAEIYTDAAFHIVADKVDNMMMVVAVAESLAATLVAAVADRADDDRVAAVYTAAVFHMVAEKVDNMMMVVADSVAAVVVAVAASFAATLVASVAVAVPAADAPAVHAAAADRSDDDRVDADRVDNDLAAAGILSAVRRMGPRSKAAVIEGNNHAEE